MSDNKTINPNPPAEFTPSLGSYKNLQPFRYWCQKVLPLVYDDSLSYYELLCKVVDYLNKTMEDVETLHDDTTNLHSAYVQLQSYVNNYFSTLDIQNEINNKLDSMANSGELTLLIAEYINPITDAQNKKITLLENRVNNLAHLNEGSTTGDAELIDIRVPANGFNNNNPYPTAGDAVRGQVSDLNKGVSSLLNEYTQLYDYTKIEPGYYTDIGVFAESIMYFNFKLLCSAGQTYYVNYIFRQLNVAYFNSNESFVRGGNITGNSFTVPDDASITYLRIPIRWDYIYNFIISNQNLPINLNNQNLINEKNYFYSEKNFELISELKNKCSYNKNNVSIKHYYDRAVITTLVNETNDIWESFNFNAISINIIIKSGLILFGTDEKYYYCLQRTGDIVRCNKGEGFTKIGKVEIKDFRYKLINIRIKNMHLILTDIITSEVYCDVDISKYLEYDKCTLGLTYINNEAYKGLENCCVFLNSIEYINSKEITQWFGKKWYAYGTSLTNIANEGKYPKYLEKISGMKLTNKGQSGGGIVTNKRIKDAVMNITDGKLEADLITLEVGANDTSATIGSIYDTGDNTFCGALNQCLRYLQENTNAQIVVMSSTRSRYVYNDKNTLEPPDKTYGDDNHTKYDQYKAIREVCALNSVYYIPTGDSSGLGYARIYKNDKYLADNIHHTELGGYNLAMSIWSKLKNIPLWYTEL